MDGLTPDADELARLVYGSEANAEDASQRTAIGLLVDDARRRIRIGTPREDLHGWLTWRLSTIATQTTGNYAAAMATALMMLVEAYDAAPAAATPAAAAPRPRRVRQWVVQRSGTFDPQHVFEDEHLAHAAAFGMAAAGTPATIRTPDGRIFVVLDSTGGPR